MKQFGRGISIAAQNKFWPKTLHFYRELKSLTRERSLKTIQNTRGVACKRRQEKTLQVASFSGKHSILKCFIKNVIFVESEYLYFS